nr:MAG TPA: hypothetical protein [Caudoviricetes sp.]
MHSSAILSYTLILFSPYSVFLVELVYTIALNALPCLFTLCKGRCKGLRDCPLQTSMSFM